MRHELFAELARVQAHQRQQFRWHAGLPQGFRQHCRTSAGEAGGLQNHPASGGERRQHGAGRDGHRKVPGRGDDDEPRWREQRVLDGLEFAGTLGVIVGEVDCLAHLDVGLSDGLAGLARHDFDKASAIGGEHVSDLVQQLGPGVGALCPPNLAGTNRSGDPLLQGVGIRNHGCRGGLGAKGGGA